MPLCHVSVCEPLGCGVFVVLSWGGGGDAGVEKMFSLLSSVGQEELAILRRQLEGKDGEMRTLQDETGFTAVGMSSADSSERGGTASQSHALLKMSTPQVLISDLFNMNV